MTYIIGHSTEKAHLRQEEYAQRQKTHKLGRDKAPDTPLESHNVTDKLPGEALACSLSGAFDVWVRECFRSAMSEEVPFKSQTATPSAYRRSWQVEPRLELTLSVC